MARTLTQQINFPIIFRMLGWLIMIEALFMCLPLAVAVFYGETGTWVAFGLAVLITITAGVAMMFGIRPKSKTMRKREGLILTATIWIVFSAFGMLPFLFTGTLDNVSDAFFETMAGFTTTGASTITDLDDMPHGVLFWRALMQWIGGMGIILFTLAVLPMLNYKGGIALFNAEVTGITHERLRPRVSQTAKDLWLIYLGLTALLAVLLSPVMGWFDSVCHALTTLSTGGLSTKNEGINHWHSQYVYLVITVFMFLGGVNFTMLFNLLRGRFSKLLRSDTFKWYCIVTVGVSLAIVWRMYAMGMCDTGQERWTFAVFDTIAAITSTGFTSVNYETKGEFITMLLMIIMFFGGMVRVDGRSVPHNIVAKVIAFLSIYLLVVLVVAVLLTLMGIPIFDALYTSISTISNLGLGYGVTLQSGSFELLPDAAKWLLAFEMLVGRLELFTVLVLFTRTFWLKD